MAKAGSGSFGMLLIGGYNLLAMKVRDVAHAVVAKMEDAMGLGDTWESSLPTGTRSATLTQTGGFFDDTTNSSHDFLRQNNQVARIAAFAYNGNTIGKEFTGVEGVYSVVYDVLARDGELTKANATYTITGKVDRGVIVQNWTTKTIDWNTKTDGFPVDYTLNPENRQVPITSNSVANPSVVLTPVPHGLTTGDLVLISGVSGSTPTINGSFAATVIDATHFSVPVNVTVGGTGGVFVRANSTLGAVAYQEVSDFSGFTGFVGKIRSSPDDITYADLVTFTNVTAAPAAERIVVNGTIDRYLSFLGDVTGTGSITVFAGLARNTPS